MAINKNDRISYDIEVNEGETLPLLATAKDSAGAAITASEISGVNVRIDDYHSDMAIKARTAISSLTNPTSYTLSHSETIIVNSERDSEYRFVTFEYTYQGSNHLPEEYVVRVKNLRYHSV
jgi:hypothetical protein